MALYIHNNFRCRLNYMSGGTQTSVAENAFKIINAAGEAKDSTQSNLQQTISTRCRELSVAAGSNAMMMYFSSSTAKLTNEYTCPDLLYSITCSDDNGTWIKGENEGSTVGTYLIKNEAENAQTIRKIAVYRSQTSSYFDQSPTSFYLQYVVDLEQPLTLEAGQSGKITLTMDFSNI